MLYTLKKKRLKQFTAKDLLWNEDAHMKATHKQGDGPYLDLGDQLNLCTEMRSQISCPYFISY